MVIIVYCYLDEVPQRTAAQQGIFWLNELCKMMPLPISVRECMWFPVSGNGADTLGSRVPDTLNAGKLVLLATPSVSSLEEASQTSVETGVAVVHTD